MNSKALYRNCLEQLQIIYTPSEAAVITEWMLESIAKLKRSDIVKSPDRIIIEEDVTKINKVLHELLQHKPIQYILGESWFYKMKFKVNEYTLIPRPETEELTELLISEARLLNNTALQIVDIGTGSGCIPVAIKKSIPSAIVSAIDISENALRIARENAECHNTHIQFIHLDFLIEQNWEVLSSYNIIVSNPPYIPFNEKEKLDKNVVDYEPHTALFIQENNPLLFYEKIAAFSKEHLCKNGKIYLETHEEYSQQVAMLFNNYKEVDIKKDIFGKERIVIVTSH